MDVFTDPSGDEEYDEYEEVDEDDFGELDGEDMADAPRSEEGVFAGVDMIMPRRSFKGARNIETVKDCECIRSLTTQC